MLGGEKRGRARSSPVHNFFRHAANQCDAEGGKFMLSRTRHTSRSHLHTRERFSSPFSSLPLFLSISSHSSFLFFLSFFLLLLSTLDEERMEGMVTMVVMDACSSTVGVTHDCCYERGERKKMEISRGLS